MELFCQIQEGRALGVYGQFAVNDPGYFRAVIYSVPDIIVSGHDAVTPGFQLGRRFQEFIPVRSNFIFDGLRVVGAPNILCDGTTIDESAAGSFIGKGYDLPVRIGPISRT